MDQAEGEVLLLEIKTTDSCAIFFAGETRDGLGREARDNVKMLPIRGVDGLQYHAYLRHVGRGSSGTLLQGEIINNDNCKIKQFPRCQFILPIVFHIAGLKRKPRPGVV
jgi:hypothetical protein